MGPDAPPGHPGPWPGDERLVSRRGRAWLPRDVPRWLSGCRHLIGATPLMDTRKCVMRSRSLTAYWVVPTRNGAPPMAAIDTVVAGALDRATDGFLSHGQVSERLTAEADILEPASSDRTHSHDDLPAAVCSGLPRTARSMVVSPGNGTAPWPRTLDQVSPGLYLAGLGGQACSAGLRAHLYTCSLRPDSLRPMSMPASDRGLPRGGARVPCRRGDEPRPAADGRVADPRARPGGPDESA